MLRDNKWQVEGNLVLKEGIVYVLKDKELRVEIIWLHHNMPVVEHKEKWKIIKLVTRNYWWSEMTKDIRKYVNGCDICQKMENWIKILVGNLMANKVLEKP